MSIQLTELPGDAPEPGVYDLAEAAYHADPLRKFGLLSLSSTTVRKLLPPSCPALARHAADHPEHKDAFDLGSVTHRLVLGSGCEIVEVAADSWQTKAAKDARERARAEGKVALLSKDLASARAMAESVHADEMAHALLTRRGLPEQTLIWQEDGTWCRAMLDRWPFPDPAELPIVVDLKTTTAVDDDHLRKSVRDFGYDRQEDWYRRGYRAVHGIEVDFWFVFVTKTQPHLVRSAPVEDDLRAEARELNDSALDVWRECLRTGSWPAYPPTATIGAPRWARTREDLSL